MPLTRDRPGPLHPLRLVNVRQLRPVEVVKPPPELREGEAGELLVQRVMPASVIDGDKAIPPVAGGQHQACGIERRPEGLAALRAARSGTKSAAFKNGRLRTGAPNGKALGFSFQNPGSKSPRKASAIGNEPMTCDFEQIVRLPLAPPRRRALEASLLKAKAAPESDWGGLGAICTTIGIGRGHFLCQGWRS